MTDASTPSPTDAQAAVILAAAVDKLAAAMVAQPQPVAPPATPAIAPSAPPVHPIAAAVAKLTTPRGIRNNNPGNVRKSQTKWQGEVVPGTDKSFCQFTTMVEGVRCTAVTLHTYYTVDKCLLLGDYIRRWAPTNENNTALYVSAVSKTMGVSSATPWPMTSRANMEALCHAIFRQENGGDYVSTADLQAGVAQVIL